MDIKRNIGRNPGQLLIHKSLQSSIYFLFVAIILKMHGPRFQINISHQQLLLLSLLPDSVNRGGGDMPQLVSSVCLLDVSVQDSDHQDLFSQQTKKDLVSLIMFTVYLGSASFFVLF